MREGDHRHHRQNQGGQDQAQAANLGILEDRRRINENRHHAEDRGEKMMREVHDHAGQEAHVVDADENQHRRQDQQTPPLSLFHVPAHEAHREGQDCPEDPVSVVGEKQPAVVDHILEQVDQRLADQEKDEAFQGGVQRGLAVHDNQNSEQDPDLKGDRDIGKGGFLCDFEHGHQTGVEAGNHRKDDEARPGQVQTAEELLEFMNHSLIPHFV